MPIADQLRPTRPFGAKRCKKRGWIDLEFNVRALRDILRSLPAGDPVRITEQQPARLVGMRGSRSSPNAGKRFS
jgi:hypothetical protein